ncbi:hypothetical protein BDV26DRAFT_254743, partial [Aspergillus bertholletiae]
MEMICRSLRYSFTVDAKASTVPLQNSTHAPSSSPITCVAWRTPCTIRYGVVLSLNSPPYVRRL